MKRLISGEKKTQKRQVDYQTQGDNDVSLSKNIVTTHFESKQLLSFGFAQQIW